MEFLFLKLHQNDYHSDMKTITLMTAVITSSMLTGCASFVDKLNESHKNLVESAKDSPVAVHKDDVKPVPASSVKPKSE